MVALEKPLFPPDGLHRPVAAAVSAEPPAPTAPTAPTEIDYPDSDGEPLSDNTLQLEWIMLLLVNLDAMLPGFVAGDLLWYPVEGRPDVRLGPDVLVALERPKGYRGSYMQFREDGLPPDVVFEVLSPRNTMREMVRKGIFYLGHGAKELIVIDPDHETGWAVLSTANGETEEVAELDGWVSPTLQIRFAKRDGKLEVWRPDGTRFRTFKESEAEVAAHKGRAEHEAQRAEQEAQRAEQEAQRAEHEAQRADQEAQRADHEAQRASQEAQRAEQETQRADQEAQRAERLAAKLAALGIDPADV